MYVLMSLTKCRHFKLTAGRSIVASIVRVVYGFQIEHAGRAKPTDVDGIFSLCFCLFKKLHPTNTAPNSRRAHNASLLGNARSRHLPHRHEPSLPALSRYEKISTLLGRQHPQRRVAHLITVARVEKWQRCPVTVFEDAEGWIYSVECAGHQGR